MTTKAQVHRIEWSPLCLHVATSKLSNTPKLSLTKYFFVLMFNYGHESYEITERILSQVQAAEMRFLRRAHDETLHDKVRSCEVRQPLTVESLRIEISAKLVRQCDLIVHERLAKQVLVTTPRGKKAKKPTKDQVEWLDFPTCLLPSSCGLTELSDIAVDREVFRVTLGLLPPRPRRE